jgi:hypothetical protein
MAEEQTNNTLSPLPTELHTANRRNTLHQVEYVVGALRWLCRFQWARKHHASAMQLLASAMIAHTARMSCFPKMCRIAVSGIT